MPINNKYGQPQSSRALDESLQRVIACTNELVDHALRANWNEVLDGMEARRNLLQSVMADEAGRHNNEVFALSAAVAESERALMRVVAHAIAGSRWNGAAFTLYH
jgi:hypothetical protein